MSSSQPLRPRKRIVSMLWSPLPNRASWIPPPDCSICLTAKCCPSIDPPAHQYRLPEPSQPSFFLPPIFLGTASGQSRARPLRGFCIPGSSFAAQASSCCSFSRGDSGEFPSPPALVLLFLSSLDNQYETRMQHRWARYREHPLDLRGQRSLTCMEPPRARTGRPYQCPTRTCERPAGEGDEPQSRHERW